MNHLLRARIPPAWTALPNLLRSSTGENTRLRSKPILRLASRAPTRSPHPPPTSKQYTKADLPWFDYYDDAATAVGGAPALDKMKSVAALSAEKGDVALPENESVTPENLVVYRKDLQKGQVREGAF
jgi:hypothetical protein